MLPCQKCGHENELGRIFCHQCGTRLDLSQIKAPGHGGKKLRRKGAMTPGRIIRWGIDAVIVAILGWGLYLMCQVPALRPVKHSDEEAQAANDKKFELEQHINQKKPYQITFSESELNSLVHSFHFEKREGSGIRVEPTELQLELGDGVATSVFVGKMMLGPMEKEIYVRYTCAPKLVDGRMEFVPVSGAVGDLPIHPKILSSTGALQNYFRSLFGSLSQEKVLLDQLTSVSVGGGQADLAYVPAGTKP